MWLSTSRGDHEVTSLRSGLLISTGQPAPVTYVRRKKEDGRGEASFYVARDGPLRCQINVRAVARKGSSDTSEVMESFCYDLVIIVVI